MTIYFILDVILWWFFSECERGHCDRDRNRMVIGFTTICAINAQSSK